MGEPPGLCTALCSQDRAGSTVAPTPRPAGSGSASQKRRSRRHSLSSPACHRLLQLRSASPIAPPPPSLPGCSADSPQCSRRRRATPRHDPRPAALPGTTRPTWLSHSQTSLETAQLHRKAKSPSLGSSGKDASVGSEGLGLREASSLPPHPKSCCCIKIPTTSTMLFWARDSGGSGSVACGRGGY